MEDIIKFVDISVKFPGVLALDNVNFSIKKGEIQAIVGENGAGKTTLMNILIGEVQPNNGNIIYKGKTIMISDPQHSLSIGISIVYQERKLCPNLSIVENIFLGREKKNKFGLINWKKAKINSKKILEQYGFNFDINTLISDLTVGEHQIVEIAKAVSLNSNVLILDEPTSSLTFKETDTLFENIRKLKNEGVTIIFISHRLEEVFRIADRISVLRNGKYLGTYDIDKIKVDDVITLIAGRVLAEELSHRKIKHSFDRKVVLEVKSLNRKKYLKDVSFKLYEKEILGIYGIRGAGRTELLETIFGLEKADAGEIYVHGKKLNSFSVHEALNNGIAMVPEDRRGAGLFINMGIDDNICAASNLDKKLFYVFLLRNKMIRIAEKFARKLRIKYSNIKQPVAYLSGGNQQKVIISRWLTISPKILLLDEVTKGIDVGAKVEIYKLLRSLINDEGISVILASSELPEIIAECGRVLVMNNGKIVASLTGEGINKKEILSYSMVGNIK